ncbi:TDP-N-acetylfucosamine:lipid II N-acetylfucosaminyltransferase [Seramator thermalis]|uniref:TDP-N-acetylfucosamine:lipid II N-acetylfucosaminyltransferase n=1 Tax=Seramator thermalis TaxID=2496270 RepID=UPI00101C6F81|nr:TDP-N-acetylfucosamine:lipid II N-acetylfucosaminyltransferase [Seramator thermalis]
MNILHIFPDDKFFDSVSDTFDEIDMIHNTYLFYISDISYKFKYIKKTYKLKIVHDRKEYLNFFSNPSFDVVFFHSLPEYNYNLINYTDPGKIIIWWSWGFDIYDSEHGLKALIPIDLYKPLTKNYIKQFRDSINMKFIRDLILKPFFLKKRGKAISRIDYYSPVLPIEYELMKKNSFFHAKLFLPGGPSKILKNIPLHNFTSNQNILIGNSATPSNNHLDILNIIKDFSLKSRQVILPLSYGDQNYADFVKQYLPSHLNNVILQNFLTKEEYNSITDNCSHAIFGNIRQQSLGNIHMCLRNGTKVYLFKDSLVYKQLTKNGYKIFTIEDDLTQESIDTPLPYEDAKHNHFLYTNKNGGADYIANEFKKIKSPH